MRQQIILWTIIGLSFASFHPVYAATKRSDTNNTLLPGINVSEINEHFLDSIRQVQQKYMR